MTEKPLHPFDPQAFGQSLMARASDLAHYAHSRGQELTYVRGTAAHDLPVTIIVVTGRMADEAATLAKAWTERLADLAQRDAAERAQN